MEFSDVEKAVGAAGPCGICGCVYADRVVHVEWHERVERKLAQDYSGLPFTTDAP